MIRDAKGPTATFAYYAKKPHGPVVAGMLGYRAERAQETATALGEGQSGAPG